MCQSASTRTLVRYAAVALVLLHVASAQDASPLSVAISNVTVVDVITGELRQGVTVVTQGERITAVGKNVAIPAKATRIDGQRRFLIPGLWDMHAHHQGTGKESLDLFVAKGVTGARDMGGDVDFILPLRERVRSGAVLGPEILTSGPILDAAPPTFPYRRRVTNAEEARQALADLKRLGVDFIKVHDHTPREVFFTIAEEAPKLGLTFAGHVPAGVKVEEAAGTGMSSIEHLSNYNVFGECIVKDTYTLDGCRKLFGQLAAGKVWQTPTMAFYLNIPELFSGHPLAHAEYASDTLRELTRKNQELSKIPAKSLEKMRLARKVTLDQVIRDLDSMGVRFRAGCDALVPGFCLHDELEYFTKAGLTPLKALQTATINPARFLGREQTQGSIEAGKRADLILLEANPLSDIRNVAHIRNVVVRGKLVTKSDIDGITESHRRAP